MKIWKHDPLVAIKPVEAETEPEVREFVLTLPALTEANEPVFEQVIEPVVSLVEVIVPSVLAPLTAIVFATRFVKMPVVPVTPAFMKTGPWK